MSDIGRHSPPLRGPSLGARGPPCDPASVAQNSPLVLAALPLCAALCVATLAAPASAEDKNPAAQACKGKKEGEACTFMKLQKPEDGGELQRVEESGVCNPGECCELDYSKGSPPQTNCGPCLVCEAGGGPTPPIPSPDGGDPASEPPRAADEPPAQAGNGKRGCSVHANADQSPALGLMLLLGLLCGFRRLV